MKAHVSIPMDQIRVFCEKWKIKEFSLFGSVLRDDFRPDSDIDVLVTFAQGEQWDLLDIVRMETELRNMFKRAVDLVEEICINNPYRRRSILHSKETIYAA